jgi:methylmalonyl-CoA mutase N-terminal domain/subunit
LIKQFEEGKLVLVGVNKFQNKNEGLNVVKRKNTVHPSGIKTINLSESVEQQLAK